jgi:hypothetical protein
LSARFAPSFRPAFHGFRSLKPGSYSECPIACLPPAKSGQGRRTPRELQRKGLAVNGMTAFELRNVVSGPLGMVPCRTFKAL